MTPVVVSSFSQTKVGCSLAVLATFLLGGCASAPVVATADSMADTGAVLGDSGVAIVDTGIVAVDRFVPRTDVHVVGRCQNNAQCDDHVACTIDECVLANSWCLHRPDLNRCECDPGCHHNRVGGMGGRIFGEAGRMGVDFDGSSGGLIVRANPRMSDYLWVPNTAESTVSKWDAVAEREVARYRVGLPEGECRGRCCYDNGCNQVSRVVVDGQGNAFAASRGFGMQGSVTKMAAELGSCVDRNMNGMIETSTGARDVLPYGADECVLWTANVGMPNVVLRSITIDRGDALFPEGYAWVGGCANTGGLDGNAGLFQLNPRTGATIRHVDFSACAYGAVVTSDGTIWQHTLGHGITSVDPISGRLGHLLMSGDRAPVGGGGSYGVAADGSGRVWVSRPGQDAFGYDPRMHQWTHASLGGVGGARVNTGLGITVDGDNHVWVAGPSVAYEWDANSFRGSADISAADIRVHNFAAVPGFDSVSAIGADRRGNIWMASSSPGPLVKYDPMTHMATGFSGPNQVYTYSDFTGSVRRLATRQGLYSEVFDLGCVGAWIHSFEYTASTPPGTSLAFTLRTTNNAMGVEAAPAVSLGVAPGDMSPVDVTARLLAAGINPGRYVLITVHFNPTNNPVQTPVLHSMAVSNYCPTSGGG